MTKVVAEPTFSPAEVMKLWNISPGNYEQWRARKHLDHDVVKSQGGTLKLSRFSIAQMCKVGVQISLIRDLRLNHVDAKAFASDFAESVWPEIWQLFIGPLPALGTEMNIPYVIITGEKPEWFRVHLNDPVRKIQERIGNRTAVMFDVWAIVEKVCAAVYEKDPEFLKWSAKEKAKRN